ncbi:MAG: hypothetical protein HY842_05480 [Bacteroidetes bacterium]|nr:hypothetical protein [Bacteroidota bacterium]
MNLQLLNDAVQQYKIYLKTHPQHDPYWTWESQRIFQENWDMEATDFRSMYDRSLQNSHSRRLWKRENYEPKEMMLRFIELNREFVRQIFQDLFNENKEVDGRIGRFVFHCDELLLAWQEAHPRSKENTHFHDETYEMVSLYLAFRYPAQYLPYDFEGFRRLMELLGSRDVPTVNDVGRYFKVMRTLFGFLKKDAKILALHSERIEPRRHFEGETLLVAEDFLRVVTGGKEF